MLEFDAMKEMAYALSNSMQCICL